jgi:hypothetical protein
MEQRLTPVRIIVLAFGGRWGLLISALLLVLGNGLLHAPVVLAFPYHQKLGNTDIYSEAPISHKITRVLARADNLLKASPINVPGVDRQVVLTKGGWRWKMMALNTSGAIGLRRPFCNVLIFNRSDIVADRVTNSAPIAGTRTLSDTIAHETIHLPLARRYGELKMMGIPAWKQEGYADYIAKTKSVDPSDEAKVRTTDPHAPVLFYYESRRRVAAALKQNGDSVDALMEQ